MRQVRGIVESPNPAPVLPIVAALRIEQQDASEARCVILRGISAIGAHRAQRMRRMWR